MILGPGNRSFVKIAKLAPLTNDEVAAMKAGKAAIYVWGHIEYRDTFGKRHFSDFAYVRSDLTVPMSQLVRLADYNDAD